MPANFRISNVSVIFVNMLGGASEHSHEAQRSELLKVLVERGAPALTEDDWRRELVGAHASGPGLESLENVIHALISTPECYVTKKVRCPARSVHLDALSPTSPPPQAPLPIQETRRAAALFALNALLLLNPSLADSSLASKNIPALMSCLVHRNATTHALAASALVYGCSPRGACIAVVARIEGLPRAGSATEPAKPVHLASLCSVACSMLRVPSLVGSAVARRLDALLFALLRDHSCDASSMSEVVALMLGPRVGVEPVDAVTAGLDFLAKVLEPRSGLVGARFCRRSQAHQCAVLELLAVALSQLVGASDEEEEEEEEVLAPRRLPPQRLLAPHHAAQLCDVVARGVALAAEKSTASPGREVDVAQLYAHAADAVLCAAKSASRFIGAAHARRLDALLPPSDAASPSAAILVHSKACADFKKARGCLESVVVACGSRQVVPLPAAASHPETTLLQRMRLRLVRDSIPLLASCAASWLGAAASDKQLSAAHTDLLLAAVHAGLGVPESAALSFDVLQCVLEHAHVFDAGALLRVLEAPSTAPSAALALALQRLRPGEPAWSAAVSLAAYYASREAGGADAVANWLSAEAALSEQLGAIAERAQVLRASLREQVDSEVCAAACRAATAAAAALQPAMVAVATRRLAVLALAPVVPPLRVVACRTTASASSAAVVPPCNDGGATADCSGGPMSEPEPEPRVDGDVDADADAGSSTGSARSDGSDASDPRLSPRDDVSCCDAEREPEPEVDAAAGATHGPGTLPGLGAARALPLVAPVPLPLRAPAKPERRGLPGVVMSSLRRVVSWAGARPWARFWQADPRPGLELRVPATPLSTKEAPRGCHAVTQVCITTAELCA